MPAAGRRHRDLCRLISHQSSVQDPLSWPSSQVSLGWHLSYFLKLSLASAPKHSVFCLTAYV